MQHAFGDTCIRFRSFSTSLSPLAPDAAAWNRPAAPCVCRAVFLTGSRYRPSASRNRSASMAALQPVPAAVIACR